MNISNKKRHNAKRGLNMIFSLKLKLLFSSFLVIFFVGCAQLPDAKIHYNLPVSDAYIKVISTLVCNSKNKILSESSVIPSVVHTADTSNNAVKTIDLSELKGIFSDSEIKVEFYSDGRLKSLNGSSTGQGQSIITSALPVLFGSAPEDEDTDSYPSFPTECDEINKFTGGKPLTLTYQSKIELDNDGRAHLQEIKPDEKSDQIINHLSLQAAVGNICTKVGMKITPKLRHNYSEKTGDVLLKLREPGFVLLKVSKNRHHAEPCSNAGTKLWEGKLVIAQYGKDYNLPIPKARVFGTQGITLALEESGSLSMIQYNSKTGLGQTFKALDSAVSEIKGPTALEKAAQLRAENDIIAQQQRRVVCLADPENC